MAESKRRRLCLRSAPSYLHDGHAAMRPKAAVDLFAVLAGSAAHATQLWDWRPRAAAGGRSVGMGRKRTTKTCGGSSRSEVAAA